MIKHSAGILLYRRIMTVGFLSPQPQPSPVFEFLLVHPGGPFWAKKDEHAWSMPKGEVGQIGEAGRAGEMGASTGSATALEESARREFEEETGMSYTGTLTPLPPIKTPGKIIHAFLGQGDFDVATLKSNFFEMVWPPKSGHMLAFPEVDRAEWFDAETAKEKIHKGQVGIIEMAERMIRG